MSYSYHSCPEHSIVNLKVNVLHNIFKTNDHAERSVNNLFLAVFVFANIMFNIILGKYLGVYTQFVNHI